MTPRPEGYYAAYYAANRERLIRDAVERRRTNPKSQEAARRAQQRYTASHQDEIRSRRRAAYSASVEGSEGWGKCPSCDGSYRVRADGKLRKHFIPATRTRCPGSES